MDTKVLIVTSSNEPNVSNVSALLKKEPVTVIRINVDTDIERPFSFAIGEEVDWSLSLAAVSDDIRDYEALSVWYRRPELPQAPNVLDSVYHNFIESETRRFLWSLWTSADADRIFWVNHPLTTRLLENNKPLQLRVARRCGLSIPETLITNDPEAALVAFKKWNGEMIVKTFGSRTDDLSKKGLAIYTSRVSMEDLNRHAEEIRFGPVLFQRYIPKDIELRITIVGGKIFTCAIHSQDSPRTKDDWRRYDFARVDHEVYRLPDEVQDRLLHLMNELHLAFGAIDMILTPDGDYVFLEVNPSGQWGWIETITGLPISQAISDLLVRKKS